MYEIFNYFEIEEDYRITSLSGRDIFDIDNSIQGFRHFAYRLEKLRDIEEDEWKKKCRGYAEEDMHKKFCKKIGGRRHAEDMWKKTS